MHYYQHHIGDFIKATARLTDSQAMAYLRLLWMYYDTERPLKPDLKLLAFQAGTTVEEIELILNSFFWLADNGWHNNRCDNEIAEYHALLEKRSTAGRASAERRKNKSSTHDEQVFNKCSTDVQLTSNQEPVTSNQFIEVAKATRQNRVLTPPAPIDEIVGLYNEKLPMLARVTVINDSRRRAISARWREVVTTDKLDKQGGVEFFSWYFDMVSKSKFLTGRTKDWKADIDFLFNAAKFPRIVEGTYHKE